MAVLEVPTQVESPLLSMVQTTPTDYWNDSCASAELATELQAHCAALLAKYKLPRAIDFTQAMPRDPNGKLYKRRLRDPYWERSGRDV